uniref:Uncharacterized protein n=1 Tax=Meloidogyne incognita TaxID=6306 RepID=A0A914P1T6_MELIC
MLGIFMQNFTFFGLYLPTLPAFSKFALLTAAFSTQNFFLYFRDHPIPFSL